MNEEKKRMAATALGLPKDVVLGDVLLRFTGFHEVCIENYRSILMYTDTLVRIQARNCRVTLHGRELRIRYYNQDAMGVCGQIQSMEFEPLL
ncbi:YabP/YqfC family sporulation protein [Enterocloster sp. HCN-30185]|uniref:YabP/YqfC family sporulation protein n=1 Tax=Enterocloster sp. HCN-30185 TaxID=3134663 RepID=UPI0030BFCA0D